MPIEDFLRKSMPLIKGLEPYVESWERISESTASLQKYSNVPLLFEFVKLQSEQ